MKVFSTEFKTVQEEVLEEESRDHDPQAQRNCKLSTIGISHRSAHRKKSDLKKNTDKVKPREPRGRPASGTSASKHTRRCATASEDKEALASGSEC